MSSIQRLILGLVFGLAGGAGGLATLPAAAQGIIDCGMVVSGLPPELSHGGEIACGEPGGEPHVAEAPHRPAGEGPRDICAFFGFCGAAAPGPRLGRAGRGMTQRRGRSRLAAQPVRGSGEPLRNWPPRSRDLPAGVDAAALATDRIPYA
jgi:hypothetical protein